MKSTELAHIENCIYVIRGQKVMLDSDLALLYQVETKALNRQVNRHLSRFPEDFMFKLTLEEHAAIKTQTTGRGGRRYLPFAFTEGGVAMLSSILASERAAQINIAIIRTFIRLRSFLSFEAAMNERMGALENGTHKLFKVVFERLDSLESQPVTSIGEPKRKIGLKPL